MCYLTYFQDWEAVECCNNSAMSAQATEACSQIHQQTLKNTWTHVETPSFPKLQPPSEDIFQALEMCISVYTTMPVQFLCTFFKVCFCTPSVVGCHNFVASCFKILQERSYLLQCSLQQCAGRLEQDNYEAIFVPLRLDHTQPPSLCKQKRFQQRTIA